MGSMLFTQDGSSVEVEQVWVVSARQDADGQWIQMGGRVALMPNGAYCHGDGNLLPFEDEDEIRRIFTSRDKEGNPCILPEMQGLLGLVLNWFAHRAEFDDQVIRKVVLSRQGYPEFEDGTPAEEPDIYAWYEPGPALSAAIVGLYERRKVEAVAARASKPDIYRQGPTPPPGQTKVAGDLVASPKKGGKPLTRTQLAKSRATRAANKAAKATPNPTPASQPETTAAMG
jgi:hypothetical protein